MIPTQALEQLKTLAEGWEVAADAEQRLHDAYKAELDAFSLSMERPLEERNANPFDPLELRKVRVALEARDNAARFAKDAAAIRTVLENLIGQNRQEEPPK